MHPGGARPEPVGAVAQVDGLGGADQLHRCQAQRQGALGVQPPGRQRGHRHPVLDAAGEARGRQLDRDRCGQEPHLGGQRGGAVAHDGQRVVGVVGAHPQAVGQAAEGAGQQLLDPLARDGHGVGHADAGVVQRGRDGAAVEVADRDRPLLLVDHERVVARRTKLDLDLTLRVVERVAGGGVGLGHDPEGQRVLQVAGQAAAEELAALEQLAQPPDAVGQRRVRSDTGHHRVERRRVGQEALEAQRRRGVEGLEREPAAVEGQAGPADREGVRVDHRERLLRGELHRLQPGAAHQAVLADEGARDLRQGAEVRLADRPDLVHRREHPGVQRRAVRVDQLRPHPGAAERQPLGPHEHRRPHHRRRGERAVPDTVRQHQTAPVGVRLGGVDVHPRQHADAGRQAVHRLAALEQPLDRLPGPPEGRAGVLAELHRASLVGHRDDVGDVQRPAVEDQRRGGQGRGERGGRGVHVLNLRSTRP